MPWLQTHITISGKAVPFLDLLLNTLGAVSVTYTDAGDEPQLEPLPGEEKPWSDTIVTGLFEVDIDPDALTNALETAFEAQDIEASISIERLEDQPWERAWMESFKPMQFGERLWIIPQGQELPEATGDTVVITLDPGLAFGTGTHPTTSLCLQWLDGHDINGKAVIDYGCGSGVLSIAALLLGAAEATGIDYDPQALMASHDNALKNGVAGELTLYAPEECPSLQCDLLLANILTSALVELSPLLSGMVRPGGQIVLSGILHDQVDQIVEAFGPVFDLEEPLREEEWVMISGTKRHA